MKYDSFFQKGKGTTKLEFGSLAEPFPIEEKTVKSLVAEYLPNLFNESSTVRVLDIRRTAFEKLTILHKVALKEGGEIPSRYSRHYYDLYQILVSLHKKDVLDSLELVEKVAKANMAFYPAAFAKYEEITKTGFQLIPSQDKIDNLRFDYKDMEYAYFGNKVDFDEILKEIKAFESEINPLMLDFYKKKNA